MNCGFSELRSRVHSVRNGPESFPDAKRPILRQIDAPVPPLIVHLQRIRTDFSDNGTLEYINIECWSNKIYECKEEFAVVDHINVNQSR